MAHLVYSSGNKASVEVIRQIEAHMLRPQDVNKQIISHVSMGVILVYVVAAVMMLVLHGR
jgi:hypothetical protein